MGQAKPMPIAAHAAAGTGSSPQEVEMLTPHARDAPDSGPVASQSAFLWRPAIAVIAVPVRAGTMTHASHGTVPDSGYSPRVTAARHAITQPATTAGIRRFTRRG